jgi:hypothetical protein
MGVIKLSGWTYCTTLNCEYGSNKTLRMNTLYDTERWVHSSVSYNVFTLRVLLLPGSQFSVVQYVLPESFITPRLTVQCRTICSSWVLLLPGSQFSVVQCVHLESFITPIFTVQCRTICSPWEFYYSHVHSSVSYNMNWTVNMGVINLSGWTYCTTLNCEYGSNKTLRVNILYDTELWTWE